MKIAALSDIHGNLPALRAVLDHAGTIQVDVTVNLGDICSGPLWPEETADLLMSLDLPTIRGNHERQVLTGNSETMGASDRHAALTLRDDQREWLSGLPTSLRLSPEVDMVHGTHASDLEYFLHTVTADGVRPATLEELEERAGPGDAQIILCGHTHIAGAARLSGGRMVVNPGSVGLPAYDDDRPFEHVMENGTPHARYATLARTDAGWSVDFHLVAYDWEAAAQKADAEGRQDWSRALRTGRVR